MQYAEVVYAPKLYKTLTLAKNRICLIYQTQRNKFSNAYMRRTSYINKNNDGLFEDFRGQNG